MAPYGSATWKKKQKARGTEPDACYYVATLEHLSGYEVDLERDPPPDIAVEIDSTSESISKFPIYAALGVPEIWRYDVRHSQMRIFELSGSEYLEISASKSFPSLTAKVLADFIQQGKAKDQAAAMAAFRAWLKKTIR